MFRPPPILIHKKSKLIITQQKQSIKPVNRNRFRCPSPFLPRNKIQGSIGGIQEGLSFEVFEVDYLKAFGAANAEFGF